MTSRQTALKIKCIGYKQNHGADPDWLTPYDHSSLMIKRMNCELTRLLRQQTSTQPGPTTSHETALGRTARASALVGRFAWSKTQEEDELVEVPNEDSEAVAAVLVVIRRDCGLLVLNRLIHNSVSLRKAPEGIGYR